MMQSLKLEYNCFYEEKDAIGKRYRRQDALGTPFCITIDHQTLEDKTITIRYRDTMEQARISFEKLREILASEISWAKILS
jgi:glycyl-tRNA synthetase